MVPPLPRRSPRAGRDRRSWRGLPGAGWRFAAAVLLLAPIPLAAQAPTPRTVLVGRVSDSLQYVGPLAGATIFAVGGATTFSDSAGRFRLGPLPSGRQVVAFSHPWLDSIGVFSVPREVDVPDADSMLVELATPSRDVLYRALCDSLTEDPAGIVTGRVHYSETGEPASRGDVLAYWTEWVITPKREAVKWERTRRAPIRPDGSYRLCNVPTNVRLTLQVALGTRLGLETEVSHGDRLIVLRNLSISLAARVIPLSP